LDNLVLVAGVTPLWCIRAYAKRNGIKNPQILNKLVITAETAHIADHAVKFAAIDKETNGQRIFVACFKKAKYSGIYLTSVKEITPVG
jgi:hypothetical protein